MVPRRRGPQHHGSARRPGRTSTRLVRRTRCRPSPASIGEVGDPHPASSGKHSPRCRAVSDIYSSVLPTMQREAVERLVDLIEQN